MRICDYVMTDSEKYLNDIELYHQSILQHTKPEVFDSSRLESVEHQIEDRFEDTCCSLSDQFPAKDVKKLTAYEFFSLTKYAINKNKRVSKVK